MFQVVEAHQKPAVWTDLKPRGIGNSIMRIGWVESGNVYAHLN